MIARWILAALHLIALGIGFGAVWARDASAVLARVPVDTAYVVRRLPLDGSQAIELCAPATTSSASATRST